MKPKIVLLGEHPLGSSGNSGMMQAFIADLDFEKYDITCLSAGDSGNKLPLMFRPIPFPVINVAEKENIWGHSTAMHLLRNSQFDILITVGIDIWQYIEVFQEIIQLRDSKRFKIMSIFPFDIQKPREEWIDMLNALDFPWVYSEYGYNSLRDFVPRIQYFRPKLHMAEIWKPFTAEERKKIRSRLFHGTGIREDVFLLGFVGINQWRKDPQTLVKAFSYFSKEIENSGLYLHTEKDSGVFNLAQYAVDCDIPPGKLLTKPGGKRYPIGSMPQIYNGFDLYVNCSMQEGLSWTVIEAMLCGIPSLISDTTAHKDLTFSPYLTVPCDIPNRLHIKTKSGGSWIDAFSCSPSVMYHKMTDYYRLSENKKTDLALESIDRANKWVENCDNIGDLLDECLKEETIMVRSDKKEGILFVQHSAAGDILMTTRCLKGLKERHPGLPLYYMTQDKYHDILRGNRYIEDILSWNPRVFEQKEYSQIYNPHGDTILPGHWGRNCNSILSDFYWKILRVKPDDFFIEKKTPDRKIAEEVLTDYKLGRNIAIVHTTGGDPEFRTYMYMAEVSDYLESLGFLTVQLGGKDDYDAGATVDFRGKLSFREAAWVMNKASIAVAVDSFISHLAGALGVNQVCLFGSGNYIVVQPKCMPGNHHTEKASMICLVPDYVYDCKGLGPCSANVRDCPLKCTGKHDPKTVCSAISTILNEKRGFYAAISS